MIRIDRFSFYLFCYILLTPTAAATLYILYTALLLALKKKKRRPREELLYFGQKAKVDDRSYCRSRSTSYL